MLGVFFMGAALLLQLYINLLLHAISLLTPPHSQLGELVKRKGPLFTLCKRISKLVFNLAEHNTLL